MLHKTVNVISIAVSLCVVALAALQLFGVWSRAIDVCVPLMSLTMLCQAYIRWNNNRTVAYLSIATAICILICAIAVFFLR